MTKDPKIFLRHILESIDIIERYSVGVSKEEFLKNIGLQDQIVRRVEIIGEAVKNIPEDFKSKHPTVPWKKISGTRDFLIHEYFSVDLELLWVVVQKELPNLKVNIEKFLSE